MEQIERYIMDQKGAWMPSTMKSELSRLRSLGPALHLPPEELWVHIEALGMAPYSVQTLWTRVCCFHSWQSPSTPNLYQKWKSSNRNYFKYSYKRSLPTLSGAELRKRLNLLPEPHRAKALQVFTGGLRWSESLHISPEGWVMGKGGKRRMVFVPHLAYGFSYATFNRALAKVGLKPHDLRKIAATELCRKDLHPPDICAIMGWESFETARSYWAPQKEERLKAAMETL